jgi:hypothetical protein
VTRAVLVPKLQERVARLRPVARFAQALSGDERDVMVARQRLEGVVALHRKGW